MDFLALGEVAAGDVVGEDGFAVFGEFFVFGGFVDAVDGWEVQLHETAGDGFVGEEHALFDELVGDVVFVAVDAEDAAAVIEADFVLGEVEVEGAVFEAGAADVLGELMGLEEHFLEVIRGLTGFDDGESLLIGEAAFGVDDGGVEPGLEDGAPGVEEEFDAFGEAVDLWLEGAEFVAEGFRQHGDDAVHEVGGVTAQAGFFVELAAGADVVGDVGDVDPEFPMAVGGGLDTDGVVEVFGVIGVDGDDVVGAAVGAIDEFFRAGDDLSVGVGDGAGFVEDGAGEGEGEVVLAEDGEHVDAFLVGWSEDFDDFAFGAGEAVLPGEDFDDDFVADLGFAADVFGFGDDDLVLHARVIGDDVEDVFALGEGADEAAAFAFEDADDSAGAGFRGGGAAEAGGADVEADEDAVTVHGGAGGVIGDGDFFEAGSVGLDEAAALAGELDDAGDEVGLFGGDVAIVFGEQDAALGFELIEGGEEAGSILFGDREHGDEDLGGGGAVVLVGEALEDDVLMGGRAAGGPCGALGGFAA